MACNHTTPTCKRQGLSLHFVCKCGHQWSDYAPQMLPTPFKKRVTNNSMYKMHLPNALYIRMRKQSDIHWPDFLRKQIESACTELEKE